MVPTFANFVPDGPAVSSAARLFVTSSSFLFAAACVFEALCVVTVVFRKLLEPAYK